MLKDTYTFSSKDLNIIYESIFRDSTNDSGFYFQDMGKQIDSKTFRQIMIELKEGLSNLCKKRSNKRLNYHWMGRFNHQHTSGFHRDNAAEHSFLILGYEPTKVDSRVYLADYTKLIEKENISLNTYFHSDQEENVASKDWSLKPYVSELTPFYKDTFRLVILDNSKSFNEKTFGVFHRGEVLKSIDGEDRVINSIMLHLCDSETEEQHTQKQIRDFVNTDRIDR